MELGSARALTIRVRENDVRTLAAEFQRDAAISVLPSPFPLLPFEIARRRLGHDDSTDLRRAGEGDFVDVAMARDRRTRGGTEARKDVHHSRGKARLAHEGRHVQSENSKSVIALFP